MVSYKVVSLKLWQPPQDNIVVIFINSIGIYLILVILPLVTETSAVVVSHARTFG